MAIDAAELTAAKRDDLPDSSFAYIDSNGDRHLPIHDPAHVRAALSRFNQTQFESADAKAKALAKIRAAAKKFGIETSLSEIGWLSFDDPAPSDVAVPGIVSGRSVNPKSFAKNLVQRLKEHFSGKSYMTADDLESHIRRAAGHAGGKARAAGEEPEDAEPLTEPTVVCSDTGDAFRVFVPVNCDDAPEWIPYLPTPGVYDTQKYGKIELTPSKYDRLLANFRQNPYGQHLPVTLEHSDLSGAAGYLRDMRKNADGSLDVKVEWNQLGRDMLADKRYRHASAEFFDAWKNPATGEVVKDVPKGHTLTTYPLFKPPNLRALIASESGLQVIDSGSNALPPEGQKTTTEEVNMSDETTQAGGETQPDDVAELKRQLAEQQARAEENEQRAKEAQEALKAAESAQDAETVAKKLTELESEKTALSKRLTELESVRQKEAFQKRFSELGVVEVEQDKWVSFAEKLHTHDPELLEFVFSEFGNLMKALSATRDLAFASRGVTGVDPNQATGMDKIRGLMASENISYAEAYRRISTEDPKSLNNRA